MNKYLLMSAAALIASSAAAAASDESKKTGDALITFSSNSGNAFCDEFQLQWNGNDYMGEHIVSTCNSGMPNGPIELSLSAKTKDVKNGSAVPFLDTVNGGTFFFSTPIKTGGTWDYWVCESFSLCFLANEGNYKLANDKVHNSGRPATTAQIADILKARKANPAK
jgi:hypothetical protein